MDFPTKAWPLGAAILTVAGAPLLFAQEPKSPPPKEEPKTAITLPTAGTVVPLPKASERRTDVSIEVDAKGRISAGGKALTLEALGKDLQERSTGPRTGEIFVTLRLDRDLPWQAAEWVLGACHGPRCRVYRTILAVHPEGAEEEDAVAAFPHVTPGDRSMDRTVWTVPVKLEYDETEIPVVPADLYPFLKTKHEELDGKTTAFEIEAAPSVPFGDVLAAADAAVRHGSRSVLLLGRGKPAPKDLEKAVAALPARKGALVLTVMGTRVLPPSKDAPRMPAVELVDGGSPAAGALDFRLASGEEIEIEPDPPEKPR